MIWGVQVLVAVVVLVVDVSGPNLNPSLSGPGGFIPTEPLVQHHILTMRSEKTKDSSFRKQVSYVINYYVPVEVHISVPYLVCF